MPAQLQSTGGLRIFRRKEICRSLLNPFLIERHAITWDPSFEITIGILKNCLEDGQNQLNIFGVDQGEERGLDLSPLPLHHPLKQILLNSKTEVHYIAVAHNILFTFQT